MYRWSYKNVIEQEKGETMERETNRSAERAAQAKLLAGRLLCIIGLLMLPLGAYFVSVALEFAAFTLGVVGFYLGARNLAVATLALSVVAAFVGLLWGQGYFPKLGVDAIADGLRRGLEGFGR